MTERATGEILSEDRNIASTAARGRKPVTWHPLFPAFAAVWFAALFGLGTLAVHVSLLERIAVASGIDRLIPAAAPPLGVNARILIALALAMLGGAIGTVIGRAFARSKPAARARRAAIAAESAAKAAEPAPAKAATFDETPSFIDISQLALHDDLRIESDFAFDERQGTHGALDAADGPDAREPFRGFSRPLAAVSFPLPDSFPIPGGAAAQRLNAADLDSLSHLELIERLALSLQQRREEAAAERAEAAADEPQDPGRASLALPSYYPPAPEPLARKLAALRDGTLLEPAEDEVDTRPIALFPAAEGTPNAALRHDSAGTERALRDALAALQRMSGAA
ncbi:MAG: hypothetical protein ABIQ81_05035 [Novosphingobium sp.]